MMNMYSTKNDVDLTKSRAQTIQLYLMPLKVVNSTVFLAELLLCYLIGNIFGVEISYRQCADNMQTMCGWRVDDVQMTKEWDFGWDFTGHMSS